MKRQLLALIAFISVLSSHSVVAHPGGHLPPILQSPEQSFEQSIVIPETSAGILQAIEKQMTLIQASVKKQELSEARVPAMTVKVLVKALGKKLEKTSKLQDSVAAIETLASTVINSSGAGAKKATTKNASKLAAAISKLQSQMVP
jgi:hypothetical protein